MFGKISIRRTMAVLGAAVMLAGCTAAALPIQASAATPSASASAKAALELNKTELTLGVGESCQLKAVNASENTLKWSSSAASVITVDEEGNITAKKKGTATVTVKDGTKNASCKITVKPAPTKIQFNKEDITLGIGETYDLSTSLNDGAAAVIRTYTSSDPSVAEIIPTSWNCKFKAVKPGIAYIFAETVNHKRATCVVTVKPAPTKVSITKTSLTLGVGETYSLGSNIDTGAASSKRTYRTSNSSIIKMTRTNWIGEFKAMKAGVAWVTVRTHNGKEASCKITVKPAPTKVNISKTALTLGVGESYSLSSTLNSGAAAAKRTFRTSNSSVIKMTKTDWTGEFKAMKAGVAWVTVRTYNGKEASCKITVKAAPSKVTPNKKTVTLKVGQTGTVGSYVNDGAAAAKRTYAAYDTSIIKMTQTNWEGKFKALKPGVTYVSVETYNSKRAYCKVVVTGKTATYEEKAAELVNDARVANGREPVVYNTKLAAVAKNKSQDMANNGVLSMNSPTYGAPQEFVTHFGITGNWIGTFVGKGYRNPQECVNAMLSDSTMKSQMLDTRLHKIGVGYVASGNYWTIFMTDAVYTYYG